MAEFTSEYNLNQEMSAIDKGFLSDTLAQTKDKPLIKRDFHGKFFNSFTSILRGAATQLHETREDLLIGILKPRGDMGKTNYEVYVALPPATQAQIDRIREQKDTGLANLIQQEIAPAVQAQTIPQGVLDIPPAIMRRKAVEPVLLLISV